MDTPAPRSGEQRTADVRDKLAARHADVWVASASKRGDAHLVPLSYAWHDERVILAAEPVAITPRNIGASGKARLAIGATRDVVMIDAVLEASVPVDQAPAELADAYARQADWDPRAAAGEFVFLLLSPRRVQAWREANELAGRTVMRDGRWLF